MTLGTTLLVALALRQPWRQPSAGHLASAAKPLSEARQLVERVRAMQLDRVSTTRPDLDAADRLCERAATLDPIDAEVWATWAYTELCMIREFETGPNDRRESARVKAARAMSYAPKSFHARLAQAGCLSLLATESSRLRAESMLTDLLAEQPNHPGALRQMVAVVSRLQRSDEALPFLDRLARVAGYAATAHSMRAWTHFSSRRLGDAAKEVDESLALETSSSALLLKCRVCLEWLGDLELAKRTIEQAPPELLLEDSGAITAAMVFEWRREPEPWLRVLRNVGRDWLANNHYSGPKALLAGRAYRAGNNTEAARNEFRLALTVIDQRLTSAPGDAGLLGLKVTVLDYLGEDAKAGEMRRLIAQVSGQPVLANKPTPDERIDTLEKLPRWFSHVTAASLRLRPDYDDLRAHPRFQALLRRAEADPRLSPRATAPASVAPANTKSIAVLPFVNLGADKGDEYLGDGLTEELLNTLAKIKGLRVPGRSSCFAFKGKSDGDIFKKMGAQLNVGTVLEGTLRRAGSKVRISAQLINVADGFRLWGETYDKEMDDILAIQTEVAQRVIAALQLQLGAEETRALGKKPTENPEAHRLYLLGRHYSFRTRISDWQMAIEYFQKALQLDPNYALAYCGWGDAYSKPNSPRRGRDMWAKQREFAEKALMLEANLAEAHLSLGEALCRAFDWQSGRKSIDRAIELNPNLAAAYNFKAWAEACHGNLDAAIQIARKASELDPLNLELNFDVGYWLQYARRYEEAVKQITKTLELDPNSPWCHAVLGWCALWLGDLPTAVGRLEKAKALELQGGLAGGLGYAYAISGQRGKAEELLLELELLRGERYISPGATAQIYLGLGEHAKALEWLEKCQEDQDWTCWYFRVHRIYDPIRADPRFQALLKKVGLDQ